MPGNDYESLPGGDELRSIMPKYIPDDSGAIAKNTVNIHPDKYETLRNRTESILVALDEAQLEAATLLFEDRASEHRNSTLDSTVTLLETYLAGLPPAIKKVAESTVYRDLLQISSLSGHAAQQEAVITLMGRLLNGTAAALTTIYSSFNDLAKISLELQQQLDELDPLRYS